MGNLGRQSFKLIYKSCANMTLVGIMLLTCSKSCCVNGSCKRYASAMWKSTRLSMPLNAQRYCMAYTSFVFVWYGPPTNRNQGLTRPIVRRNSASASDRCKHDITVMCGWNIPVLNTWVRLLTNVDSVWSRHTVYQTPNPNIRCTMFSFIYINFVTRMVDVSRRGKPIPWLE